MPQFHETYIGKKTLDSNIPKLIRALERIADSLESIDKKLGEKDARETGVQGDLFAMCFSQCSNEDEEIKRMDDIMPDGTVRGG